MHFVYILYSQSADKYYVGETENPAIRVRWQNTGEFKGSTTSVASDWVVQKPLEVDTVSDGKRVEGYIKFMKSRKFLIKLISENAFLLKFRELVKEKFRIAIK